MIKWTGKSTNGTWKRTEEVDTMKELFDACVENDTINTVDYDAELKYIAERAGFKYSEVEDAIAELDEERNDWEVSKEEWIANNADGTLTDKDYWLIIANENGNAYYQTFEKDGKELEFDENGMLK